jgi:hypothetical protein
MTEVTLKKKRLSMFVVSILLGIVIALVSYLSLNFPAFASLFIFIFLCIPSVWQLFFMPVQLKAKHYFFSAGQYSLFWAGPLLLYLITFHRSDVLYTVGYIYLGAVLLLWGLGAFLRE